MTSFESANQYSRAFLAWTLLTSVAAEGGTITYKAVGDHLGIHHRTVRFVLEKIQTYCIQEPLPPLTILVVSKASNKPQKGFIAWDHRNLDEGFRNVHSFRWGELDNPFAFAQFGETPQHLAAQLVRAPDSSVLVYAKVQSRGIAQTVFRIALREAYGNRCAFCGLSLERALEAAHIVPWSNAGEELRLAPANGLLLCATHHALFDAHVLLVMEDYRIAFQLADIHASKWSDADRFLAVSLDGVEISLPADPRLRPGRENLRLRLQNR